MWGRGLLARLVASDPALDLLLADPATGILVLDPKSRIRRHNAAMATLAGIAPERIGLDPLLLFAEPDRDNLERELRALRARGQVRALAARTAAGTEVAITLAPATERDGKLAAVLLRAADLTALRALETQLAQSQKQLALGQLAAGIAHDFNNLLTAVLGSAEAIALRDPDAATLEDAAQIRASAERGGALVRQLLAFGRQQVLAPRPVAVNETLAALRGLLSRLLGARIRLELALEQNGPDDKGPTVRADPVQLDQVLINLAVNARDAMMEKGRPEGGVLRLASGHATLHRPLVPEGATVGGGAETIPPGRWVTIEVADTGAGMSPEVMARIFEPFFTTRREKGGSGLGLSTVHGIVRQSDGYLTVASTPGQGTVMRVWLPRFDGAAEIAIPAFPQPAPRLAQAGPEAATRSAEPRRTVLLVEDEAAVRRLAERFLAAEGWRVIAAADAEQALAALEVPDPPQPDVLVTDLAMPGMDGVSLIAAARARLSRPGLPAIVASGYADEASRAELEGPGIVFMPKPYTPRELAAKLAALIEPPAGDAILSCWPQR
jgi:two-component system, cell cycle sensor histidine kinase and response regulator CckA